MITKDLKFLQMFLSSAELYKGKIDGIWGPKTDKAHEDFHNISDSLVRICPCDVTSEKYIKTLLPKAQEMCRKMMLMIKTRMPKVSVKILSGLRTYSEQHGLYAIGRTLPGDIVTKADSGRSYHNFGIAWDVGIFNGGSYVRTNEPYDELGRFVKLHLLNVTWGGDFESFKDRPHYQITQKGTIDVIRKKFEKGELWL